MTWNWNRIVSALIAALYLIFAYVHGGAELAFKIGLLVIFPLACIWFANAMGGYTGPTTNIAITKASPGLIVAILGWLLLLLPVIIRIISALAGP